MLLILLDGWEGARRSDDVRRVRILLDGKEPEKIKQKPLKSMDHALVGR